MKIPYTYPCGHCDRERTHWAHINEHEIKHRCVCGYKTNVLIRVNITTGLKLLYRAGYEIFKKKDFPTGIIFSAMAYEAEQFRLYKKRHTINQDQYIEPNIINNEIKELFRQEGSKKKFNMTCRKLTGTILKEFLGAKLLKPSADYPLGRIDKFNNDNPFEYLEKNLFYPRNDVIHGYDYTQSREKTIKAYNAAYDGIELLKIVDKITQ